MLSGASSTIFLLQRARGTEAVHQPVLERDYRRHWTPVHLDFVVEDVDKAVAAALALGATLDDPAATYKWGRIAHLADPFGNGFCLLQFLGRGYDEVAS